MVRRRLIPTLLVLAGLATAPGAVAAELDGYSGARPLRTLDLAGSWDFQPKDGERTSIEVPGGGWYKQGHTGVAEATYSRRIDVPRVARGQVTRLELGAVNHEATLFVDGKEVGTNTTSFTPSVFDLSRFVVPGRTHELRIEVKSREALTTGPTGPTLPGVPGLGGRYVVPSGAEWSESIARGIFGWAKLTVSPAVHISDVFMRPSVRRKRLAYEVWVRNATSRRQVVTLAGKLRSANGRRWRYPRLRQRRFAVGAGKTRRVTVRRVPWRLRRSSWWWPNVPYRAGYRAQLHDLKLTTRVGRRYRDRWVQRFGFREFRQVGTHYELNGVRVNLRGDSLQAAMYDRIDRNGRGDAIHTYPGFLPPSAENPGWPKAVDNYLRLNMNMVRIHQVPTSPYMLDVADRMGLMLTDESAIRGSENRQDFDAGRENMLAHVRDLVLRDRNHASVIRWSQANEPDANTTDSLEFQQQLYATVMKHDPTRPVSVDVTSQTYEEMKQNNFSVFQHYVNEDGSIAAGYTEDVHPRDDRPFGRGEFIWPFNTTKQGFTWFATAPERMRGKDAADIRPYALAGAWASSIPGARSTDFQSDNNLYPLYGEDNLPDPWAHPQIRRVQAAFSPLLVSDIAFWEENKRSDPEGNWPSSSPTLPRAQEVTRRLRIFNDDLRGRNVEVSWALRRDSPDGALLDEGRLGAQILLGRFIERDVEIETPTEGGRVYLVLSGWKRGAEVFRERGVWFDVR